MSKDQPEGPDKAEGSDKTDEPGESSIANFKALTKRLLKVSNVQLKEELEKAAKQKTKHR